MIVLLAVLVVGAVVATLLSVRPWDGETPDLVADSPLDSAEPAPTPTIATSTSRPSRSSISELPATLSTEIEVGEGATVIPAGSSFYAVGPGFRIDGAEQTFSTDTSATVLPATDDYRTGEFEELMPPIDASWTPSSNFNQRIDLRWEYPTTNLTADEVLPVRWDEDLDDWMPVFEDSVRVTDGRVVVETDRFSLRSAIISNVDERSDIKSTISQTVGELFGTRSDGPTCSGVDPSWVDNVIYNEIVTASLRVCTESRGENLLIRIVNNRPYGVRFETQSRFLNPSVVSNPAGLVEWSQELVGRGSENTQSSLYIGPLGEIEFEVPPLTSADEFWTGSAEITVETLLLEIFYTLIDLTGLPTVGPVLDVMRAITTCVVDSVGATIGSFGVDEFRGLIDAAAECVSLIRDDETVTIAVESAVRAGVISPEQYRKLFGLASYLRAIDAGRVVNKLLDLGIELFVVPGDPTVSVLVSRSGAACNDLELLDLPDELLNTLPPNGASFALLTFYDDSTNEGRYVLRRVPVVADSAGEEAGWFFSDSSYIGQLALDGTYISDTWGSEPLTAGVAGVTLLEDGTTSRCGPIEPVLATSAPSKWPVGRNDGSSRFYIFLGASFDPIPQWVSCWEDVCLAGNRSTVRIYGTDPFGFITEIPTDVDDPYIALIDLGATVEQAEGLLAPEAN